MRNLPLGLLLGAALIAALPAHALDVHRPAVSAFIAQMVRQHHYPRTRLVKLLGDTRIDPAIIHAIEHPAEALPWYKYRAIFITPPRIRAGRAFLAAHGADLDRAWNRYGVPPEIIAALVGMESFYGRREGSHSALSALVTLAFGYPPRGAFFRKELADYLVLCRDNGLDPAAVKASYAGALGAGQFMPSSYLAYAVDADGGGSNLFTHWPDITASIANFLASHGWRADEPIAAPAAVPAGFDATAVDDHPMPARALRAHGVVFDAPVAATAPVRLIKTATPKGTTYWVGLPNFSVLMSYNRSPLYALAAAQLAGDIGAGPSGTAAAAAADGHG